MEIRYDVESNVGQWRRNNEDMALVDGILVRDSRFSATVDTNEDTTLGLFVFDGMGGRAGGEIASEMSASSMRDFIDTLPSDLDANELILRIKQLYRQINDQVITAGRGTGMGTTMSGLLLYYDKAFFLNSGDSRVYRLRHDYLKQMTVDHSERERLKDDSVPSNLIYNAIGVEGSFVDVCPTSVVEGDRYLICSDGVCDMLSDQQIEALLKSAECTSNDIVQAANYAGGYDNITAILIDVR